VEEEEEEEEGIPMKECGEMQETKENGEENCKTPTRRRRKRRRGRELFIVCKLNFVFVFLFFLFVHTASVPPMGVTKQVSRSRAWGRGLLYSVNLDTHSIIVYVVLTYDLCHRFREL
jgi:hypothetical protein